MLEASPRALCEELDAADEYRKKLCAAKRGMVSRYVGPYYDGRKDEQEAPENFYHEYVSYLLSRLVYSNPRFNSRSRRIGPQAQVAKGIGHALNRWCVDKALRKTLVPAATDYLFTFTVLLTTQQAEKGVLHPSYQEAWSDRVPHLPSVTTIENDDFYFDPLARTPEGWRYAGHGFVRDLEDLVAEAEADADDWDLDAVKALAEQVGEDRQKRLAERNLLAERGEVELIEVWVPEHFDAKYGSREEAEADGYHGMIYTVSRYQSNSGSSKLDEAWIRKPFAYYGPRWGPYTYIGCYPVPGEAARLSPLIAVEAQTQATNRLAMAVQRGAEDFKTLEVFNGDNKTAANKIKNAPHHTMLAIPGFDASQVAHMSVGGNHPQQIESLFMAKDRRDRSAGLGEAQRGATTSGTTATEVAVASNSSALRMDYILQQWTDGVTQLGRTVGWYLYHDNRVLMPLDEQAALDLGYSEGVELFFEGGDHDPQSGATFDDLELEIEPYSMERTDQGLKQHQMLQMFGPLPNLLQLMGMFPTGVDWAEVLDMYGDAFNMPGLGQKVHPEEIAAQMGAQAAPAGSEGPLLSSTVGGPAGMPKPARGAGQRKGMSPAMPGQMSASPMSTGA